MNIKFRISKTLIAFSLLLLIGGAACKDVERGNEENKSINKPKNKLDMKQNGKTWQEEFGAILPLLGHRNWILVVDKAFPLQTADGMTCIDSQESLPDALQKVLGEVTKATHIKPLVYLDKELKYMTDELCAGADSLKATIDNSVREAGVENVSVILHDEIFAKLDAASKLFAVVVIKTECLVPYSSVFIELDCGYWNADKEKQLRELVAADK